MPTKTASALSDEDIRRKYYETAGHSMWITEMQLDPLQLIVCDDGSGKYFQVPIALKGGDISFGEPLEVAVQYVPTERKQSMSALSWATPEESREGVVVETITTTAASGAKVTPDAPSVTEPVVAQTVTPAGAAIRKMAAATQTPPAASTAGGSVSTTEQEASGMPFDAAKLREALGLKADASADDALKAFAGAMSQLGGGQATTTSESDLSTTNPEPVKVPALVDGNRPILLDPSQLSALQESARKGEVAWAQLRRNERDGVLDEAIKLGKFPAIRRDYWVQLWDRDPDGTRDAIAALAANIIPVLSPGYLGDDSAHRSADRQAYEGLYGEEGN